MQVCVEIKGEPREGERYAATIAKFEITLSERDVSAVQSQILKALHDINGTTP